MSKMIQNRLLFLIQVFFEGLLNFYGEWSKIEALKIDKNFKYEKK